MKSVQDPTKSIYKPHPSSFRTFGLNEPWNNCRVTFHDHHQGHIAAGGGNVFMYKCGNFQSIEMLIKVLEKLEKRLKLVQSQRLVLGLLESDNDVLYIETGNWWANPLRHNLLTAFLKDATHYDKLDLVIQNGKRYLERTQLAINKFLDGNVYYGGNFFEGWVDDFHHGHNLNLLQDSPGEHDPLQVRFYNGWKTYEIYINKD